MSEQKLDINELKKSGMVPLQGKRYVFHLGQDRMLQFEF